MAKRGRKTKSAPVRISSQELSRHQREQRQQRLLFAFAAAAGLLIVGVLGLGYLQESFLKGLQPIVSVGEETISLRTYAQVLAFERRRIEDRANQLQNLLTQLPQDSTDETKGRRSAVQQELNRLSTQLGLLDNQVLGLLMDGELMRREAGPRGIVIDDSAIDDATYRIFGPVAFSPLPSPTPVTSPAAPQPEGLSVTPTAGAKGEVPISPEQVSQAKSELSRLRSLAGTLSEPEVRRYLIEPAAFRAKLGPIFANEVTPVAEQVEARHILVDKEDEAKAVLERLNKGEDFSVLAKDLSKDQVSAKEGGELGWFPRGIMVSEFEQAAFSLQPGQMSDVVKSPFGYHIILVEGREQRELLPEHLLQLKTRALDNWLNEAKRAEKGMVTYAVTQEKIDWARKYAFGQAVPKPR